jgi:hypothetical protein
MPSYDRLGPHDCHRLENSRREPIQQYKDKPIERFQGRALGCAATQNVQLVPKRDYLSFERTPRPEEVQEDPPEQIEELEHPAFIARFGRSGQADGICGRDTQIKQIAASIERFGFTNPVLMSEDGEIVAGHGRVAAARLLGLQTVPALRLSHLLVRGNYIVR